MARADFDIAIEAMSAIAAGSGPSARGSHRLADVYTCPRKWMFRYVYHIVPLETGPAALQGTLHHRVAAEHYADLMDNPPEWRKTEKLDEALVALGEGDRNAIETAREMGFYYKLVTTGESVKPVLVEEELRVTLAELNPEGQDEDEIHYERTDSVGKLHSFHAPRLNAEIVTCRPDAIVEEGGLLYVWDHKTMKPEFGNWAARDRLPKWKEADKNPYSLNWQSLLNLHISRIKFGVDRVAGFKINRIKSDQPFDQDRHTLVIPEMAYAEVPSLVRYIVKRERELGLMLAKGENPPAHYWSCFNPWPCDYVPVCRSSTKAEAGDKLVQLYRKRT